MKKSWIVTILIFATLFGGFFGCKQEIPPPTDTTAPANVTNFTVTAVNGNAVLSWTNPTDSDFAGVKISMTPAQGSLKTAVNLDKNVNSYEIYGLTNGTNYTFTIQTYDTSLNYSTGVSTQATVVDTSGNEGNQTPPSSGIYLFEDEMNPTYSSRTKALDTIFNPDELGHMVLVFDRSEWNKHLEYCYYKPEHEENVVARGFYFTKDNKEWFFKDIGFRIRGNTSRKAPQEKLYDEVTKTYSYGDYTQAHFALDFEEWTKEDKKLADSMKGLILKRFKDDYTYSREIYSYNLFRQNGIWIAPRASYTTLKIQIIDDLDLDGDGDITEFETIDYGVYGMIEEIKKQFLKERTLEEGGGELESNKGNLWKCTNPADFVNTEGLIGEENVSIKKDENGNFIDFINETYPYDYKGDNELSEGQSQLENFIRELNTLPNCNDGKDDETDIATIKNFYETKMDYDLFLRTYAINVILGMWDDYWINSNNFYFYFDKNGKAYFIPYDYDNSLGTNGCNTDAANQNPLNWGSLDDGRHPLIQKMLQVPEYMEKYKEYLLEYSDENSYFDDDQSIARITNWQKMIKDYIYSDNLKYEDTSPHFEDKVAWWGSPNIPYTVYTPGSLNYFTVRQKAIANSINPNNETLTLTINAGKGSFINEKGETSKTISCDFYAGEYLIDLIFNIFDNWEPQEDKHPDYYFSYSYEEDGKFYYFDYAIKDNNGIIPIDEEELLFPLYESATYEIVYASYVPVTFNLNGGTYNGNSSDVVNYTYQGNSYNSLYDDILPEKEDALFMGWTRNPNGEDYVNEYEIVSEITLYAKWLERKECTLILITNENSTFSNNSEWTALGSNLEIKFETGMSFSEILQKNDISFWCNQYESDGRRYEHQGYFGSDDNYYSYDDVYKNNVIFYDDITLSAYFNKIPKVTFNLNGGTYDEQKDDITQHTNWINLNNPTRDGYIFMGWTRTPDGEEFVTDVTNEDEITLYAKWISQSEIFSNSDLAGDFAGTGGIRLTYEGDGVYSYTFTYSKDMQDWNAKTSNDNGDGTYICEFKFRPTGDWDGSDMGYNEQLTVDKGPVFISSKDRGNICVNLEDGKTYKIKIICGSFIDSAYMEIVTIDNH